MQLIPLNDLRNIFGSGKREAQAYRNRLTESCGTVLAAAPNKASFLQNLCQELQFDTELASKMHEDTNYTLVFCIASLVLHNSSMLAQNLILILLGRCIPY